MEVPCLYVPFRERKYIPGFTGHADDALDALEV